MEYFGRYWSLKIKSLDGSLDFEIKPDNFGNALRVQFDINAAIDFRYYSGSIKIYNLDRDKRKKLNFNRLLDEFGTGPAVQLQAGYVGSYGLIFNGVLNRGYTVRESETGDWVTNMQIGIAWNGAREVTIAGTDIQSSTLKSFLFSEVEKLLDQPDRIKIPRAKNFRQNFNDAIDEYLSIGKVKNKSITYHGTASRVLEEIAQEFNLIFYLDHQGYNVASGKFRDSSDVGSPVTIPPNTTTPEKVIRKTSGLIGSPLYTDTGARIRTYLMPDLRILQLIRVESEVLNRNFSITDLKHVGDTYSNEWYSEADGTNFNQFAR